ncbi:MAG: hypothetical protein Q9196_004693 [Gyalolechia fulgens]
MALRQYARPYQHILFAVGEDLISLSNATIKSYLPNLWRSMGRRAMIEGHIDLESLVIGRGLNTRLALSIILNALKASESETGVSNELKRELDDARATYAAAEPDPEGAMLRIFKSVAILLSPHNALGRHDEMAYAMSEWCTILATEDDMHPATIFDYILVLDLLQADVTGPLHSLLRRSRISPASIRRLDAEGGLRPRTMKKFRELWKDHRKSWGPESRLRASPDSDLIPGHYLSLTELIRRWHQNPESITVDLGPKRRRDHRRYDEDEGWSAYDDIRCDDPTCICEPLGYNHHRRLANGPLLVPRWQHPAMIAPPPRIPSPMLLGHRALPPAPFAVRPPIRRNQTTRL